MRKVSGAEKSGGFCLVLVIRNITLIDQVPMVPPESLYATLEPGDIACIPLRPKLAKEPEKIGALVKR